MALIEVVYKGERFDIYDSLHEALVEVVTYLRREQLQDECHHYALEHNCHPYVIDERLEAYEYKYMDMLDTELLDEITELTDFDVVYFNMIGKVDDRWAFLPALEDGQGEKIEMKREDFEGELFNEYQKRTADNK